MWMITLVLGLLPVVGWVIWWWNEIWYVWSILAKLRRSNSDIKLTLPPGYLGLPFLGETLPFQWFFNIIRRPDDFIKSRIEK